LAEERDGWAGVPAEAIRAAAAAVFGPDATVEPVVRTEAPADALSGRWDGGRLWVAWEDGGPVEEAVDLLEALGAQPAEADFPPGGAEGVRIAAHGHHLLVLWSPGDPSAAAGGGLFHELVPAGSAERAAGAGPGSDPAGEGNLQLLLDVPLEVTVELGRTERQIRDILALAPGTVIELDRLAGEPVDVLVNGRPIARGEVVVIDENFGIRITDIVAPGERLRRLT
jgi:flagellar motor switch protein FliN